MPSSPAKSVAEFELKFEESYNQFQRGFLQGSNPKAFGRLLTIAAINAARTMVKPMQAEAPVRTGRLRKSINAKRGQYQRPSATVGPRPGRSRGDRNGAWYRWFVTTGVKPIRQTKNGPKAVKGVQGRPFVTQVANKSDVQKTAMNAYWDTIGKFFDDKLFRDRITKFKRRG